MRRLLWVFALLCLPACEDVVDFVTPCVSGFPPDLTGSWNVHGEGQRTGCADKRLNGDVTIATAPLVVVQEWDGQYASLSLAQPIEGVEFKGGLDDHCYVSFEIVEPSPDGPVAYRFAGDPDSLNGPHIERGTFTATGPGTCQMSGTFAVHIGVTLP
jgi:hypothetical protein